MPSLESLEAERKRRSRNKIATYFPDDGPRARALYAKHLEFFAAGATYKERLFMAANRVGKSDAGAYELACHLTGIYPAWWTGKRFPGAIEAWACGTNAETTRNIVQAKLLGPYQDPGTGFIPGDLITHCAARRSGLEGALEGARIRHVSGDESYLGLKTYEQSRKSFEGTAKHLIWCDEEPPEDCYVEMLYRTVTTRGIVFTTFTPLQGRSAVITGFLEPSDAARQFKWYVQAGWDDVPHIDADEKRTLLATTPSYQIDARTKGEPSLGAGAIYPIPEADVTYDPLTVRMAEEWPRVFAMDVGWNRTAVLWGARDPGNGRVYIYDEHYQGHGEPASHAEAIKARGPWITGVIDPACLGSSQIDGRNLMEIYSRLGLDLQTAVNAVESGISEVWQLMVGGRLKISTSCQSLLREFRKYHRDDKGSGKIVKTDDHALDALRYLVVSGRDRMTVRPEPPAERSTDGPCMDL